jgi:hypothetical protein
MSLQNQYSLYDGYITHTRIYVSNLDAVLTLKHTHGIIRGVNQSRSFWARYVHLKVCYYVDSTTFSSLHLRARR